MRKVPDSEIQKKTGSNDTAVNCEGVAFSRRLVLGGAALVGVGAVCGMATGARAQSKMSQADAKYVDKAPGAEKCSGCAMFQAPSACSAVDGKISPDGWCSLYSPKA